MTRRPWTPADEAEAAAWATRPPPATEFQRRIEQGCQTICAACFGAALALVTSPPWWWFQ